MLRNHQLVWMRHVKVRAQQLSHQIGIGMPGIKQSDAIFEAVALCGQVLELFFPLIEQPRVLVPREQAAGAH